MSKNGLLAPTATYGALSKSYYLSEGVPIVAPTVVSPMTIVPADESSSGALIAVSGLNAGSPGPYTNAIRLVPGASLDGPSAAGLTIRSGATGTIVEVGANTNAPNHLYIAGAGGVSEVYDQKYNPVIKGTPVASVTGALPGTWGVGLFQYTPDVSGAYMLQVNLNFTSAQAAVRPTAGFIEWTLTTAGGEVQYVSNTLASTVIEQANLINVVNGVAGAIADPLDYTFSDMCILTAGVPVSFNLFAALVNELGKSWQASLVQARLIKMC